MKRTFYLHQIAKMFNVHPISALLGPRQCGKTTLAKMYASEKEQVHFFDLEDPTDLYRLQTPKLALANLTGLVVIDEIQKIPDLFSYLRVLVDNNPNVQLLILGSASRDLIRQSSETLAGRIGYIELTPFSLQEVFDQEKLLLYGGFPRAYLADSWESSVQWLKSYISTFLERDIPNLGIQIPPEMLRRFWLMLAHYHGGIFNASEIARSLQISGPSTRRYLDILTGTFMVRQLSPWFANIKKRQVKQPKIYFKDSGIYHALVGVTTKEALNTYAKLGSSWEGFALEEIIRVHRAVPEECYFWATHSGAELDLLIVQEGKKHGFEFKYSDVPRLKASMMTAFEDLNLDSLTVIYPGDKNFQLSESHSSIIACGLSLYVENKIGEAE
ncbi:MAG: ATP-binding protein [Gammaproteobacteria bacterium]|nr:ATP-binding protein [Gammaproteobacteria bacterium]